MTKVEDDRRKRRRAPKSRNGCKTCKYDNPFSAVQPLIVRQEYEDVCTRLSITNRFTVRRIKCGEQHPECIQCSSTGRKCDGYELTTHVWTVKQTPPKPENTIIPLPARNVFQGNELRSFSFFIEKTTVQIGSPFSKSLWSETVPLVAHYEPSIKHALIALSGFHEEFVLDTCTNRELAQSGLRHYNLAIQELLKQTGQKPSPVVGLLCCVIFFAAELLQGKLWSAVQLFKAGRRIIYDLRIKNNNILGKFGPYEHLFDLLKEIFIRLEYHVASLFPNLDPNLSFKECYEPDVKPKPEEVQQSESSPPKLLAIFNSFEQARDQLRKLAHTWVNRSFSNDKAPSAYLKTLGNWCSAFETLKLVSPRPWSKANKWGVAGLEVWWRQVELYVLTANDMERACDPMWWDQHQCRMEEIVHYIEVQCNLRDLDDTGSSVTNQLNPSFCMEIGFVTHLLSIIGRCRDPAIRRRALAVLKACNRQEGLLRRDLAVHWAERTIALEERGLDVKSASDIPANFRIVTATLEFDPEEPRLECKYLIGDEWSSETMTWNSHTQSYINSTKALEAI